MLCDIYLLFLAGGPVSQDEDEEEGEEGHDLGDHTVEDDQLGAQAPVGVVHPEDPTVQDGGVEGEQDAGQVEGAPEVLEDEAEEGQGVEDQVELVPHAVHVVPELPVHGAGRLDDHLPGAQTLMCQIY